MLLASLSSPRFYQHVRFSPDNLFSDQSLPMNCFSLHKGAFIVYKVGREHAKKMAFKGGGGSSQKNKGKGDII